MNRIAQFVATRLRLAWVMALFAAVAVGLAASEYNRSEGERSRLIQLQLEAQRSGIEVMSSTLNGNLIGGMEILGLIDLEFKQEAKGKIPPNGARANELLKNIATAHGAEGVFIVGEDGIIKSSWDSGGKPSTGLDVNFRPYYQTARKGKSSIYAAVSLATGKRALYFSAPLYEGKAVTTAPIGAVVGRVGLAKLGKLRRGSADIALLLSPQGVVFASTRPEWREHLVGSPTAERLEAIRALKQFGTLFESKDPPIMPIAVDPGYVVLDGERHAIAHAKVQWNDPAGDWTLVLMENLNRTVPVAERFWVGLASALGCLLVAALLVQMLRAHHAQTLSNAQLQAQSQRQQFLAQRKLALAEVSMRLQQAKTLVGMAQIFMGETRRLLGVLQGAFYVIEDQGERRLVLAGGYGAAGDMPATLALGQGLLGQCALEATAKFIEAPSESYWRISSGLGATMPRVLALLPILRKEQVLGVVELATLEALGADDLAVLDELLPMLALNLEVLLRNRRNEELAAATASAQIELGRMVEVERFNRLAQGREQRIIEVKRLANGLARRLDEDIPFPLTEKGEMPQADAGDSAVGTDEQIPPAGIEKLKLDELVDLKELQTLFSNFCEAVGVAAAIIDLDAKVLASSRWQRACTDFHRVNAESCARCIESDTGLALQLQEGADFTMYRCKNGMTDCASPIIIEGQHLANVFIGQFHVGPPDIAFFTDQARRFAYPEADYLAAIAEAPVMDEQRLPLILGFLTGFARLVSTMSLAQRRADEAQRRLQDERVAAVSLAEDAAQARVALEYSHAEPKP